MKKKFIIRILSVLLLALTIFSIVNGKVDATGYSYDHKGKVIYSTEGFTANKDPYNYGDLGIYAESFSDANPSDLFVYKDSDMGAADEAIGDTLVYLLDSGGASNIAKLYVFDSGLKLRREIDHFVYNPATLALNGTDLTKIKTNKELVVKSTATVETFNVTFKCGDEELGTVEVEKGKAATALLPEYEEGKYFSAWDQDISAVTEDMTVNAIIENIVEENIDEGIEASKVNTITFVDGKTKEEITKFCTLTGNGIIFPEVSTHAGYEFVGWDKDVSLITADATLTAQYKEIHTVEFKDGETTLSKIEVLDGEKVESTPYVPYYENQVFTGWTNEDKLAKVTENLVLSTTYTDPTTATEPQEVFVVTFMDSITGEEIAKYNVVSGGNALTPEVPSHDGHQFSKWDKSAKGITENTTITAEYIKKQSGVSLEYLQAESEMILYMVGANCVYRGVARNSTPHTDYLYICDTGNNQVLVIDAQSYTETEPGKGTYEIVQIITSPINEIGSATFSPLKCVNDAAGRVYVICEGIEDGILEFSKLGSFDRYVGTNYVTLSAWEIFTRNFATNAQLDQFTTYQNTTFTAMVYKNNMIYTTSYSVKNSNGTINDGIMIKKINPSGKDVLRRNGYNKPKGDLTYISYNDDAGATGPSQFVGITVNDYGVYTVVDNKRGRLFTYDNEGNLLYISGGSGTQLDKINIPIAVQYLGENVLVLDSKRKAIIVYEPTDIAKVINKAIECDYLGLSDEAYEYWEQVIQLNANYEYAYVGIGKHYMENTDIENNYKIAMDYFKLGANQVYYSKAFKQYRDAKIEKAFPYVVVAIVVLAVGGVVLKKVRRKKLGIKDEEMSGIGDE